MVSPNYSVAVLGRFDIHEDPASYEEKAVYYYEFEFYTEDYPGGTVTDGVFRPAKKGGFCLFKPGQMQRLVPPYRCYVMNIKTQDPELKALFDSMPTFSMLWNMSEVIKLLQQMLALVPREKLENRLRIQSYAGQIIALLSDYHQSPEVLDANVIRHQTLLLDMDRYIRNHISEDLSLASLAKRSSLDPTYFHKLFTAAFGQTPAQRVLHYRIAAVKAGLMEEGLSLDALAERCGFSSASYLGNRFRQATGQTPTQYRKENLKER